uniref:FBA_2 domain-containing protein n=1 Tax=Caenorhabditis tropicalis TaxID=1561998 RepID=A0A1I7U1A7_9PELO
MDVFDCSFGVIDLDIKPPLTDDGLILFVNWLNEMKTELRTVTIEAGNLETFEIFMNGFRKSIGFLLVNDTCYHFDHIKRLNLEVKFLFCLFGPYIHLDLLLSLDCKKIIAEGEINLTAVELNVFLRSWQEGKTNRKLEIFQVKTDEEEDIKEVLRGCGAEIMDPRTTKLKFWDSVYGWITLIHGGIHFRRNDGRLAVIDINKNSTYGEVVPEENIQKYLRERVTWNSEDFRWAERRFNIYFF